MDFIKYTINGDEWTIYLTEDDDDVVNDLEHNAEVMFYQKEIYVRVSGLQQHNILHELMHCHIGYCYLADASITFNQAEEIFCALFADKGATILAQGYDIYNKLKQLRDDK